MSYDEEEYKGINGVFMPLFHIYTLFKGFCRYPSMQTPWSCLQKSLICLQGRGKRQIRQDTHMAQPPLTRVNLSQIRKLHVQSQYGPISTQNNSSVPVFGMFPWTGTQVPLCSLVVHGEPNPVPCFLSTNSGVILVNYQHRGAHSPHWSQHQSRGKCQITLLSTVQSCGPV